MDHYARLARQTLVYGVGAVAQQLIGVVTLPIYARVFDPAQYGVVEVITVGLAVLGIFVDLGLASASQRSYFDYSDDQPEERRVVLSSSIGPSMAIALILGIGIALAHEPISTWLFGSSRYGTAVVLGALCVPAVTLATLLREVMRLRFATWKYLGSSLITAVVGSLLAIVFVLWFGWGINGVFAGTLAGNLLAAGYGLVISLPYVGRRISRRELRIMLAYGLPLIPSAMAMWMLQFVDRIMLTKLASLAEVGEYAVANRLALVLLLLVSAFGIAYSPFMLALHNEDTEAERRVRGRLLTYVTAGLVALTVLLSLFAREIIAIIAPGFGKAYQSVGLVCAGMAALGVSQVAMSGITLTRRTKLFAIYATIAAVVNIALNFALIPPWGQVGAAAATAVAYILLAVLYYIGAQRVYPTPYQPRKIIAIGVVGAALIPVGLISTTPLWLDVAAKLAAIGVLVISMRVVGVIGPEEIAALRALRRKGPAAVPVGS
ncbi:MAG: oligosaccharide flippase family protein [Solirubrobacteraceae bacterium]